MEITLFDRNQEVCDAFAAAFAGCNGDDVSIYHCSYEDLEPHDAIVTPGNSYGIMTGDFDRVIRDTYGIGVQDQIQDVILHYRSTLPPGQAIITEATNGAHRHVIYAPTMHAPQDAVALDVCYAMIAAITTAHLRDLHSIAIPGMGTGAGGLPPHDAARAMRAGYEAAKIMQGDAGSNATPVSAASGGEAMRKAIRRLRKTEKRRGRASPRLFS